MGAILWHTATTSSWIMLVPMMLLLLAICFGKEAFRADYPSDIRACMPPASKKEKRAGFLWGGLFMSSLILAITATTWLFLSKHYADFTEAYLVALLAEVVFLIYDLVIVDWFVICTLKPRRVVIPGTEHCEGWSDYKFHVKQLLQVKVLVANVLLVILPAALATAIHAAASTS